MGAILLIEDDRNVHGLIEKIFPQRDLKIFRTFPPDEEKSLEGQIKPGPLGGWTYLALEEMIREYIKWEMDLKDKGHVHDYVMGKVEKALIGIVLEEEKGNQVRAAKRLGINRNTLRKKMKNLQIVPRVVTR